MTSREIFWHNFRTMRRNVRGLSREERRRTFMFARAPMAAWMLLAMQIEANASGVYEQ